MAKLTSAKSATSEPKSPQPSRDALGDVATALHRLADVAEKFYAKLYPEPRVPQTAVIQRKGDEKKELYSDKMPEGWEAEESPDAEPGRFEKSYESRPAPAKQTGQGAART